jgi:prepilin-type N-terminal cleavage/methylation domain-containing protein
MRRGFTIIEMLIVIAIMVVVAVIVFWSFRGYRDKQALDGAAEAVVGALAQARERTVASNNAAQHGVHFATDQITIFRGASYPGADQELISLNPAVEISAISLSGGGSAVVFERLTGGTATGGSVTVSLVSDSSVSRGIAITTTGLIELN